MAVRCRRLAWMNAQWPAGETERASTASRSSRRWSSKGNWTWCMFKPMRIRVKGHQMIAWMGLCAVSVYMKFLRNAGEGESKASRTPNLPGVETQREKEHIGKAENFRRYV